MYDPRSHSKKRAHGWFSAISSLTSSSASQSPSRNPTQSSLKQRARRPRRRSRCRPILLFAIGTRTHREGRESELVCIFTHRAGNGPHRYFGSRDCVARNLSSLMIGPVLAHGRYMTRWSIESFLELINRGWRIMVILHPGMVGDLSFAHIQGARERDHLHSELWWWITLQALNCGIFWE